MLLDERANFLGHVQEFGPLFLVERHQKSAKTVLQKPPPFTHLQADASRAPT